MNFRKFFSTRQTPQNQPIPGSNQVPNSAGGYSWAVDNWTRLDRFLILGSERGTYYASEQKLTVENAKVVEQCIYEDGVRVVNRVVEISQAGRAPKNDPALFVLAMCAGLGNDETRRAALTVLPQVARIGTHLFHFMEYIEGFRGWGRGLRKAIGRWYNDMEASKVAFQAIKYQQRDGWSHRDALRLAHPIPATEQHKAVFNWVTQGWAEVNGRPEEEALHLIWAFEQAKRATTEAEIISLIQQYRLPWEAIPTQWLGAAPVWQALLPQLPMTATLRNLGRLTANGLLAPMNEGTNWVVSRLNNSEAIRQARIHPLAVLVALKTYQSGGGVRSSLKWQPVSQIVDALDQAFYLSFDNVESTGKRIMLALDVSGSMGSPDMAGMPGITPRVGAATMAMVTARTEKNYVVTIFSSAGQQFMKHENNGIGLFNISPRERLDDILQRTYNLPFGGTDCALPMLYALEQKLPIDTFIVYTDSETWAGKIQPVQALQEYRQKMGIPAQLIVVGMVSNGFTIANPNDGGMLDVVGFDTATPNVMADFIRD